MSERETLNTLGLASPVGYWMLSSTQDELCAVDYLGREKPGQLRLEPETRLEQRLACMWHRYFRGQPVDFAPIPVRYPHQPGTKNTVAKTMHVLRTVPWGEVQSYQWMAAQLGIPKAPRAAGGALGRNPIPIIVPCHRIVAKDLTIGGFMRDCPTGRDIKQYLLQLEGHRFVAGRLQKSVSLPV